MLLLVPCRSQRTLENRLSMDDDKISLMEQQVKSLKLTIGDAERKYEEVSIETMNFTFSVSSLSTTLSWTTASGPLYNQV